MTYFPNCRTDEVYNEKKLKGKYADTIKGFDMAAEEVDCFFENLEVYPEAEQILDKDTAVVNKDKVKIIREALADWLEKERNEIITAYLDNQYCEEEKQSNC